MYIILNVVSQSGMHINKDGMRPFCSNTIAGTNLSFEVKAPSYSENEDYFPSGSSSAPYILCWIL